MEYGLTSVLQDTQVLLPYQVHVCLWVDRPLLRGYRSDPGSPRIMQQDSQLFRRRHRLRRSVLPVFDCCPYDVRLLAGFV